MGLQREVEVGLGRRMRRELQVEPLILCLVQPAPGGTPAYKGRVEDDSDIKPKGREITRHGPTGGSRGVGKTNGNGLNGSNGMAIKNASNSETMQSNNESNNEIPVGRTRRRRSAVA